MVRTEFTQKQRTEILDKIHEVHQDGIDELEDYYHHEQSLIKEIEIYLGDIDLVIEVEMYYVPCDWCTGKFSMVPETYVTTSGYIQHDIYVEDADIDEMNKWDK